jgi:Fe-S cluster assembly protein SufD
VTNFRNQGNGDDAPTVSLKPFREQGFRRFEALGFPSRKQELWRHTDLGPVLKRQFSPAETLEPTSEIEKQVEALEVDPNSHRLVFLNGRYSRQLSRVDSLPDGVVLLNLSRAFEQQSSAIENHLGQYTDSLNHPFAELNAAFIRDGVYLWVPDSVRIETPIQVIFWTDANGNEVVTHPRLLYRFGSQAEATLVESYGGSDRGRYFTNPVSEFVVGANASVEHIKFQRESTSSYHVSIQVLYQERDSQFATYSMSFGGALVRNDIRSVLAGDHVTSTLNGLFMATGKQHMDHHTTIEHVEPHGSSRQLYKGILDKRASGVFNGKIFVHQKAQKTDAIQNNKNLLLSDTSSVDTQPMLEIFADDVKCTHGGTVGQLDENGIHYLRSRGIGRKLAKKMMVHSFAGDVTDQIKSPSARKTSEALVLDWLNRALPDAR